MDITEKAFEVLPTEVIKSKMSSIDNEKQRMIDAGYLERREKVLEKDKDYQSLCEQRESLKKEQERLMRGGLGFSLTDDMAMLEQSLFLDKYWDLKDWENKMLSRTPDEKFPEEHRKWKLLNRYQNTLDMLTHDRDLTAI